MSDFREKMSDNEFRVFMDLLMVSDPWPLQYGNDTLTDLADSEARERGFSDWIHAYHAFGDDAMRNDIRIGEPK